jgi:hypothetical protein
MPPKILVRSNLLAAITVCCLALPALTGCGGSQKVQLTQVKGKVTLDGTALAGARVVFAPVATNPTDLSEALPASSGFTDDSGEYTVATFQGQSGAAVGDHRVFISKMLTPDGKPLPPDVKDPALLGVLKEQIPGKYSDPNGSELKASVGFEAEEFNFDLKTK